MKHPDEIVQTSAVQLAKRRQYAQDIDALIADYERLLIEEKSLTEASARLTSELARMRRGRDTYKSAEIALAAENRTLKEKLRSLRGSKTMKIGRLVTAPISKIRTLPHIAQSLVVSNSGESSTLKKGNTAQVENITPVKRETKPDSTSSISIDDLEAEFSKNPSRGSLFRLISYEYFTLGRVLSPADKISLNSELLENSSKKESLVIQNIIGQSLLLRRKPFLPPRQSNYGFLPERGRIMYCAHSTASYNSNGYSTRTAGLVTGLTANGEDVFVAARPGYPWDARTDKPALKDRRFEESIGGVTHVFNPGPSWTGDRLDYYLAESVDVYVREAQRNRASIIHAASNFITALPALIAARRLGIPFVYEVRGLWEITDLSSRPDWFSSDRFRLSAELESFVAQEADSVLAITSQVKNELVRRGVPESSIELLPNSVDTDIFTSMPSLPGLKTALKIDEEAVVIGYSGSLVAYEGLDDLLVAVSLMVKDSENIHLVIVGDGKHLAGLKASVAELGISDFVTFTGRVSASAVPNYISIFDIMPCPRTSLPVTEMVSPLKPLEAMASGKAVVLTDLAPLRDLAGIGQERALLCEPSNPASLAKAIRTLVDSQELRLSMGRRARLWTIQERTWKKTGRIASICHERLQTDRAFIDYRTLLSPKNLRIGIISDDFTMAGLRPEADFVVLDPDTWRQQIEESPISALFVESAWEGANGAWRGKVGFYGDSEFEVLRSLLRYCNKLSIPTLFWNKEDPVHFNRFRVTAKYFDHVFTTDSDCIRPYWKNAGGLLKTVASLPFYAQPFLHNILPSERQYEHSVSFAGSFYGKKYAKRSSELVTILDSAKSHGLVIYDRQHLNSESPYRFPESLSSYVRGGLDYMEMVQAYKAHPVHINVNSVYNSPTMFSRRVMELAASGAGTISGAGRGVEEIFGGLVPVVENGKDAKLLVDEWMSNETVRMRDAWMAYRLVHRSHTAAHRITYALRTAGFSVAAPERHRYAVYLDKLSATDVEDLCRQTVRPVSIYSCDPDVEKVESTIPLVFATSMEDALAKARFINVEFVGTWAPGLDDRTVFEDLLSAASFGDWMSLGYSEENLAVRGLGLAQLATHDSTLPFLKSVRLITGGKDLVLRRHLRRREKASSILHKCRPSKAILIAGHDLKFAQDLIVGLESVGNTVLIDEWLDHNKHDEVKSRVLLGQADVIFCEWALGNAVWFSHNKSPNQRLVIRLHLQEITLPFLERINFASVDEIIFVGQHILDIAVRDHNVPLSICRVVGNSVKTKDLDLAKKVDSRFNIGFVGMVPARKRLDLALEVLKELRRVDDRYKLFVKGKRPEEFAWMTKRPDEMAYYQNEYERIASDSLLIGSVTFDAQGSDMEEWYSKIGHVISTSDFESFHLTIADGAASGAVPASLAWRGADQIYPSSWLHASATEVAESIIAANRSWAQNSESAKNFVKLNYGSDIIIPSLIRSIVS
ncbi:glycosyltransferase [Pseudarthrobacter sp. PS3-L1]|uniref:glycosyltransferase n=1 Tax=Pseudarthrobacter sp. PS3-L1 TaxID=3046207 RepID=UPI0024B9B075|nr:glycosyltransferase [Pseudarthrobacter sp. PS3-L1]MDJ0321745.1 glycosyltransferase [Pseudarthrobacter sp. PS3-L1]